MVAAARQSTASLITTIFTHLTVERISPMIYMNIGYKFSSREGEALDVCNRKTSPNLTKPMFTLGYI